MKSTLQTISLPKALRPEHCVKDIETEGILPDYSPDISRLVRVDAAPYVENVKCADGCEISGRVIFGLLYESDYKSKLAYTAFSVPFSLKCDLPDSKEIYPKVKCDCTYLTCRLLGQRKVSVKAKIDALVSGIGVDEMTLIQPDEGDLNTYFKTVMLSATLPVAKTETVAEIKENVVLDEPVSAVVYAQAAFSPAESELFDTSASVRSTMKLDALCELQNGSYKMFERRIPIELSLMNDAISGDGSLETTVDYSELSAVADLDEYGENKLINLRCTVRAAATVKKPYEITLPLDVFSRRHNCKCEKSDAVLDVGVLQNGKTVSVERSHETEGDLTAVIGAATSFEVTESRTSGNMLHIKGKAKTDVLAQSDGSVVSRSFTDDFEDSIPFEGDTAPFVAEITPSASVAELYGGSLNIRASAYVTLCANEHKQLAVLTSLEMGEVDEPNDRGIRFYYPDADETVWDIAKKYRVDPSKLQSENSAAVGDDGKIVGKYVLVKAR